MKKIILLLLILGFAFILEAQTNTIEFKGGVDYNGALSMSELSQGSDFQFKPNFSMVINMNPNIYLGYSIGIGFKNQAYYNNYNSNMGDISSRIINTDNYFIQIPMLINVNLIRDSKLQLMVGFSFDYLVKSKTYRKDTSHLGIVLKDKTTERDVSSLSFKKRADFNFILGLNILLFDFNGILIRINPLIQASFDNHLSLVTNVGVAIPIN